MTLISAEFLKLNSEKTLQTKKCNLAEHNAIWDVLRPPW